VVRRTKVVYRIPMRCESQGWASPQGPNGGFWPKDFSQKFSLGFHILIKQCPMVAAKRGAGTTDDRSGIVYALGLRFRGRCIWTQPHYETNPLSASQLPPTRCADTVGHYSKRIWVSRVKLNIRPTSSLGITKESLSLPRGSQSRDWKFTCEKDGKIMFV